MTRWPPLAFAAALAAGAIASSPSTAQPRSVAELSSCRAGHLTPYVGRPYRLLQRIRPDARYVCSTCPMTMDFRRDRLTVTYDVRTKRIRTLRCV